MSFNKIYKYGFIALLLVIVSLIVYGYFRQKSYIGTIIQLQNDIANRDHTIEVTTNVYKKATLQVENLKNLLNGRDSEVAALKKELDKTKSKILDLTHAVIRWKKAYEAEVAANQTEVPGTEPGSPSRTKVEFEKDFGYIGVNGYTLTNPPMAYIKVKQNRPLRITLAVTQDKEKKWYTYATSSEENVGIDIELSSVNPYFFKKKWYENIGINVDTGIGSRNDSNALLTGVGLSYKFNKFSVGPNVWFTVSDNIDKYYGVNVVWRPFEKN